MWYIQDYKVKRNRSGKLILGNTGQLCPMHWSFSLNALFNNQNSQGGALDILIRIFGV